MLRKINIRKKNGVKIKWKNGFSTTFREVTRYEDYGEIWELLNDKDNTICVINAKEIKYLVWL